MRISDWSSDVCSSDLRAQDLARRDRGALGAPARGLQAPYRRRRRGRRLSGAAVIVALRVAATPLAAFTVFTRDIGRWWTSHPLFSLSPKGDGTLRFDPEGPGGRLVTRFADGEEWEIGAVRRWSPGEYLAFGWRLPSFAAAQDRKSTRLNSSH